MSKLKPAFVLNHFPLSPVLKRETAKLFKLIQKSKTFLISSTLTSDGDSIGAQLGLVGLIKHLKGQSKFSVTLVNQSPVPKRYAFLAGASAILTTEAYLQKKGAQSFDLGLVCDGGIERTGNVEPLFKNVRATALVDHHSMGSTMRYDARIVDLKGASSCELVYLLLEVARAKLTKALAEALYIGMVFDTGFFKHSLTRPLSHLVAAKLIETGIDFSRISDLALLDRSWKAQLLLKTLYNNIETYHENRLVISSWSADDLTTIDPEDGDQEGMINQLYYTDTAEVVALFSEMRSELKNEVKVSFRSKGSLNVAEFARSLTARGGGHVRAAGCTLEGSLNTVKSMVIAKLQERLSAS